MSKQIGGQIKICLGKWVSYRSENENAIVFISNTRIHKILNNDFWYLHLHPRGCCAYIHYLHTR